MDIGHAHLLVAPQQGAERVTGRYALAQQVRARIQGEHRRALVVDHAAAEQPALASLHGKRVGGPARAGGHHVHVRDRGDVLRALAGDIRVAYKALVVTRLVAQSLGDAERAVQRGAHGTPERRTGLGSRRIGHGRVRNERGDIRNDVLPHLVDVRVDALHHISAHGRLLPSKTVTPLIVPHYKKRIHLKHGAEPHASGTARGA